jgi:hypothetical protein
MRNDENLRVAFSWYFLVLLYMAQSFDDQMGKK